MCKRRILISVVVLTLLEGMLLLGIMVSVRAAEVTGWTAAGDPPKIAFAWFLLALAICCAIAGLALLSSSRSSRLPASLLSASFLLILPGLLLTVGGGRFYVRYAPLAGWLLLAALQFVVGFLLAYRSDFHDRGWLARAIHELYLSILLPSQEVWIGAGLIAVVYGTLSAAASISAGRPTMHDSGIFLYFGQQILRGDIPFRDLWDHKPPLIFYIDALGLLLTPRSLWGVWLLEFASLGLAGLLGYAALKQVFPRWAAALAATAIVVHTVFFVEGGNLTEEFALPLQMAALYLAFCSGEGRGAYRRMFISGGLFGLALSLKQTMVGVWAALACVYLLSMMVRRSGDLWKRFGWAAAGAVAVVAAWLVFFAAHGALADFWSVAYLYNFLYSDADLDQRVWAFGDIFTFLFQSSLFFLFVMAAWLAGLLQMVWNLRAEGPARVLSIHSRHFPLLVALINLPLEILLIGVSGKNYRHYFLPLLPGMMLLTAWALTSLWRLRNNRMAHRPAFGIVLLRAAGLILLMALLLWKPFVEINRLRSAPATEETISTAVWYIRATTTPKDLVLVWGSQTTVNFLSNRRSPTRFVHQKPLFRQGYAKVEYSNELLNNLRKNPPELVINTFLPSTPFISTSEDGMCHLPEGPLPDGMDAVFTYLCENYHLEARITNDRWEVYRRNGE